MSGCEWLMIVCAPPPWLYWGVVLAALVLGYLNWPV